jgi:4-amino-4-deoxy-L-arabinose transferase-like glycosyltransferase
MGSRQRALAAGALTLVLTAAIALRVWGMSYGLPHPTARPDEEKIIGRAVVIVDTGNPKPVGHTYPTLLMYLQAAALLTYAKAGQMLHYYADVDDFLTDAFVTHPGLHYRICRALSVSLGVASVAVTYFLGRRVTGRPGAGLLAALTVATNYLHVRDSRWGTVDVPMTFFVTLSLLFAVRATDGQRLRDYLAAGALAGLAAATKYNAGMVLLASVAAALAGSVGNSGRRAPGAALTRVAAAALAAALAFALATPYSVLDYRATWRVFSSTVAMLYAAPGERGIWIHLRVTFPHGFGWPVFLAALAGVGRAVWKREPRGLVLLAFVVPMFTSMAGVRWVFPRYLVPLVPPLAVLAAEAVTAVVDLSRALPAALVAVAMAGPGVLSSLRFDRVAARTDTRVLAADWVSANLPGRSVVLVCQNYGSPAINRDPRRRPTFRARLIDCAPGQVEASDAPYLITSEHPQLPWFASVDPALHQYLAGRARRLAEFRPFRDGVSDQPYFYGGDAFFLPFTGLEAMERGGPVVTVWALRQ